MSSGTRPAIPRGRRASWRRTSPVSTGKCGSLPWAAGASRRPGSWASSSGSRKARPRCSSCWPRIRSPRGRHAWSGRGSRTIDSRPGASGAGRGPGGGWRRKASSARTDPNRANLLEPPASNGAGMAGDDAAFVARAQAGDREAFRVLVDRHGRSAFRLAFRVTGNEGDAEDVVQEGFLKAYSRLPAFESRARFGTWLYRIAASCAYDLLRARARRPEDPIEIDGDPLPIAANDASPERLAQGADVRKRVARALSRLTPAERAAFLLRHHEGLSIAEIGVALGLDTSAAKHSVFRAVRKMREALQPLAQGAL